MKRKKANGIKRIAINTGGGDAPGLNAVIRAVVVSASNKGYEVFGIRDGYNGLMMPQDYPDGGLIPLDRRAVQGITHLGGTILGTTNKGNPTKYPTIGPDGKMYEKDRTDELVKALKKNGVDALIALGGDGSLGIAGVLADKGIPTIGVPKTIDNDLDKTVITFGFDTAVSFATECLDRLHSTAQAHRRVIVVEVMGRYAGWIALNAGISGNADAILIPEIPYDIEKVAAAIREKTSRGKHYAIVVVAEGAMPRGGTVSVVSREPGREEKLGGAGARVAKELEPLVGKECRTIVLGHLLRGGSPTTFDRLISLRFGAAAVRAIEEGRFDVMVALDPPTVRYVPLKEAIKRMKIVPLDCDTVVTARDLGICLGD